MFLRSLYIHPETLEFERQFGSDFSFRTRYLCNFVQRKLRIVRFPTHGYNALIIVGRRQPSESVSIQPEKSLCVNVYLDETRYLKLRDQEYPEYFMSMICEGLEYAEKHYPLPGDVIRREMEAFRGGGYKNEWIAKQLPLKLFSLKAVLHCEMTINEFILTLRLERKGGDVVYSEPVLRTKPDEIIFHWQFQSLQLVGSLLEIRKKGGNLLYSKDVGQLAL